VELVPVFVLYVFLGTGEDRRKVSDDLAFRDLNECVWYAQTLTKQSGRGQITAYCLPQMAPPTRKVY
jgi:hypothetical protein